MSVATTIARSGHRIDVEGPDVTRDDVGGRISTYSILKKDIPCWVQPASMKTIERFGTRNMEVTHTIYFYMDPEILEGYRLVFGERTFVAIATANVAEVNRLWEVHAKENI